jgi:CubicO group peptidase (beta-lactamase class C family)
VLKAPERYRFILDRPIAASPGERWIYSGGAVALLGQLIAQGSGMTLPDSLDRLCLPRSGSTR